MVRRSYLRALKALKTVFLVAFGPLESHFQKHNQSLISRKKPTKLQVIMSMSREKIGDVILIKVSEVSWNFQVWILCSSLRFLQEKCWCRVWNVHPLHQLRWLFHDQKTNQQFPRIPSKQKKYRRHGLLLLEDARISSSQLMKPWWAPRTCFFLEVEVYDFYGKGGWKIQDTCSFPFCLKFGDWGLWGLVSITWWWPTFFGSAFVRQVFLSLVWDTYFFLS